MSARLVALEIDARRPSELAAFWGRLLARRVGADRASLAGDGRTDFDLRFVATQAARTGLNRMHFDLTSSSEEDQRRSVELALVLGARHLDVGQTGDEGHVVLADPEDNEFCVIEPGNSFLAGTGRIGALAGEGSRDVGLFWQELLGWPLVWDRDEETAVQSPDGGTKITWGGPPVPPKGGRNRLRWVLECNGELREETERIVALGGAVLSSGPVRAELADPEGNEFLLAAHA